MTFHPGSPRAGLGSQRGAPDAGGVWAFVSGDSALPVGRVVAYACGWNDLRASSVSVDECYPRRDDCPHLKSFLRGYFHQSWLEEFHGKDAEAVLDEVIPGESVGTLENVLGDIETLLDKRELSAGVLRDLGIEDSYPGDEQYRGWFEMMHGKVAAGINDKNIAEQIRIFARPILVARRKK